MPATGIALLRPQVWIAWKPRLMSLGTKEPPPTPSLGLGPGARLWTLNRLRCKKFCFYCTEDFWKPGGSQVEPPLSPAQRQCKPLSVVPP